MKTVMCFGTFDILHPGHLSYFQQAKKYGDKLIVVIARDKNVRKKKMLYDEKERLRTVREQKIVDKAVLGSLDDPLKTIEKINPNAICLGYDHRVKISELKRELKKRGLNPKIKRMKPYKANIYKSSFFK